MSRTAMVMTFQSYGDLKVWQKAMGLAVEMYRLTARFPRSGTYRLVAQINRAAASVPANIAEAMPAPHGGTLQTLLLLLRAP